MKVYKETLKKICNDHNTNFAELSRKLGYNRNYFGVMFGKDGVKDFAYAIILAISSVLGCKPEDLAKVPKTAPKPAETPTVQGIDPEIIKEGFRMIHADLQELIRLWKPTTSVPKLGGDNSK